MVLRYKDIHEFDKLQNNENYLQYVVSVHLACCERASNPTCLEGEVRFIQAQDQQVLPHIDREW